LWKITRGATSQIWEKKHFTRPPTLVCSLWPMVLGDIFLAQNNSGKLTFTNNVFFFFQIFDIKNLVNASKNLVTLVQFTLEKQNFPKLS
jgi:1,4-dihydroxy-2-naphthoate octaprenyltransferase